MRTGGQVRGPPSTEEPGGASRRGGAPASNAGNAPASPMSVMFLRPGNGRASAKATATTTTARSADAAARRRSRAVSHRNRPAGAGAVAQPGDGAARDGAAPWTFQAASALAVALICSAMCAGTGW
jgi:hypothetical protein